MYCSVCDSSSECSLQGQQPTERIVFFEKKNGSSYVRNRTCSQCGSEFKTYEIEESLFKKLTLDSFSSTELYAENNEELLETVHIQRQLLNAISEVVASLSPEDAGILRMSYGIAGSQPYKAPEICDKFDMSLKKLEQTKTKILRKLRHPSRSDKLRKFIEPKYRREISDPPEARLLLAVFGDDIFNPHSNE